MNMTRFDNSHTKRFSEIRIGQYFIFNNNMYKKGGDTFGIKQNMDNYKLLRGSELVLTTQVEVIPCYFCRPDKDKYAQANRERSHELRRK
jgi:hypothetical protein